MSEMSEAIETMRRNKLLKRKKKVKIICTIIILGVLAVTILVNRQLIYEKILSIRDSTLTILPKREFATRIIDTLPDGANNISVVSVSASTFLEADNDVAYKAENMIDGDKNTSWQDGAADFGKNNTLNFHFAEESNVSYIIIYNGNQISSEHFYNNNRLKKIQISINNSVSSIELTDTMGPIIIEFAEPQRCNEISIMINSVYEGAVYNDTCISEVEFYK